MQSQNRMTEGKWAVKQGKRENKYRWVLLSVYSVGTAVCLVSLSSEGKWHELCHLTSPWGRRREKNFLQAPLARPLVSFHHRTSIPHFQVHHSASPAVRFQDNAIAQEEWQARDPGEVSCSLYLQPGGPATSKVGAGSLLRGSSVSQSRKSGPANRRRLINWAWYSD